MDAVRRTPDFLVPRLWRGMQAGRLSLHLQEAEPLNWQEAEPLNWRSQAEPGNEKKREEKQWKR
jgi:hypothetical protein